MNKLLILMVEWPYGKGETFFESEANFCVGFDQIECMPLYKNEDKREVPQNIKIVDPCCELKRYLDTFFGICNVYFWQEIKELVRTKRISFSAIKSLIRYSMLSNYRYRMLKKWFESESLQDVTIYTYWMASDAVAVSRLKEKNKMIKFITRCHRFDLYEYSSESNYLPYRRLILDNVDRVYAISNDAIKYLKKTYDKKYNHKYYVSKLGTIDKGTNPDDSEVCSRSFTIVSCSNLIKVKRVALILEALKDVKSSIKWFHFGDGELREELEGKKAELPDNVSFLFMGRIRNSELLKWYKENHVDLFVNVSESEGIPVSIMEAISFGIPVLATDAGGTCEIVQNGINGILMNRYITSKELAKILDEIIENKKNDLYVYRVNARRYWDENYNALKNYREFYNTILRKNSVEGEEWAEPKN